MAPTFMVECVSSESPKKMYITLGMHIKVTDVALPDHHLVGELIKMVMLLASWKERKADPIKEIILGSYASLLTVSLDVHFLDIHPLIFFPC